MAKNEDRVEKPVSIYPTNNLLAWIDAEGRTMNRPRTRQIEYMLEEYRRWTDHNRKAAQRQGA